MKLRNFLCYCMSLGILLHIAHTSLILFGDYPYPKES